MSDRDSDSVCCTLSLLLLLLLFSHWRRHSPGRFFAANELKAMLAHIVVNYDLKVAGADGAPRPPNVYFANTVLPNQKGQVMFRKRQCAVPPNAPA
uniref:Cytochrome P450 51 n=1 Tax=Ganoderma boninense TaxID=34458 RepID=A0A5K1JXL2_9APHY|nr:Cytochrome P450 51 [Ganoderma boninense]